ncbi:pancreatic lipase-related protein 2 [Drosophila sulfurigaster albostrigata]|uniref:pancreatic lipase-related protein 2 n=1 Tax=Drosophila sulfurigaster albostrigata TaxID=89887 RepID=UPI002D21EDBD|nr:pancreatic lipase-related protein 2 [Drosophila sulfurigaster albostrigata]
MSQLLWLLPLLLLQLSWPTGAQLSNTVLKFQMNLLQEQLATLCRTIINRTGDHSTVLPEMAGMSFVLQLDACSNVSVPLNRADELFTTSGFSLKRKTVIFITGWGTTIDRSNSGPVAKAFACRNDTNFIILDAAHFIRTFYSWAVLNTDTIGRYVAKALIKLDSSYVTKNVHLIGHSLGAQIAGSAARYYKQLSNGLQLSRVTGLDPANPCFYDGKELPGTRSGDAKYVDIIISNPGLAGTSDEAGDANFFVEGLQPIKKGCTGLDAIGCSHQRAVDYFTESVYPNNTQNFRGNYCAAYASLWTGRACSNVRTAIMGYAASRTGLFYVEVNQVEPFGKEANLDTFTPTNSACGACNPNL